MRQIQSKRRYLLALMIGSIIFINGFVITSTILSIQLNRVSDLQDRTSYSIFEDKLNYRLFDEDICSTNNFIKISKDLGFQGASIGDLEERLGKNDDEVIFRKRFYSLVELEHFEFINEYNEKCNQNRTTILFFYSNLKKDLDESERVGRLLDFVSEKNKNVHIYSFDINLDSRIINNLKQSYNIQSSPSIIINKNQKIDSQIDLDKIEKHISINNPESIHL